MKGLLNQTDKPKGFSDDDMQAMSENLKDNVPPQYKQAYTRVVVAGMELLFGERSNDLIEKALEEGGDVGQKMGEGISAILTLIMKQAKGAVPGEVVIPAGIELCIQVSKYLNQSQQAEVDMPTFAKALEVLIYDQLARNGASPEQFDQYMNQAEQQAKGAENGPAQ